MGPLIDPVTTAIAHHRIQQSLVATLGVTGGDARQDHLDFQRVGATPGPHHPIDDAIPVCLRAAIEGVIDAWAPLAAGTIDQRGGLPMFKTRFK